ncbi:hypothetical protein CYY_010073 [Polysphondylium violaceum]|uniref:Uncharacterized protein n=1 Tax=Polysphondylium violaceum TaxID=133409 RepID=A0A8J4PKQ6_9MYCE|nr:hypothetical protein CYY_010073 [Polysphondylium violaceum]
MDPNTTSSAGVVPIEIGFAQLLVNDSNSSNNSNSNNSSPGTSSPSKPFFKGAPNKKAAAPSHGLTEDQIKKCASMLSVEVKDCTAQASFDGINQLPVHLVSSRDGDFVIVKVNNVELDQYQLVHGVPKLKPFSLTAIQDLTIVGGYTLTNKWNGMNIQVFKYSDNAGNLYVTAKPRATAFVINDAKGVALDHVVKIFKRYYSNSGDQQDGATNTTTTTSSTFKDNQDRFPTLLAALADNQIESLVFELCGNQVPHIVKYDFDVDLKPLFTINTKGKISPITTNDQQHVTLVKQQEEEKENQQDVYKQTLNETLEQIKEELYRENVEFRKQNGLPENVFWLNHFAQEGRVLYIMDKDNKYLVDSKLIFSVKPKDTEKNHWEQFDSGIQSKILLISKELKEKGMAVTKDTLKKELDIDDYTWQRHETDILNFALVTLGASPKKQSKVLVTCGFPASGKSYFSEKLALAGWKRINQDELGTRKKCEDLFKQCLKQGENIIIDRCNQDIAQRRNWLKISYAAGVSDIHLLWFKIDQELCKSRIVVRENHPTIPKGNEGVGIINKFVEMFNEPSELENFSSITTITSELESNNLLEKYGFKYTAPDVNADVSAPAPTDTSSSS